MVKYSTTGQLATTTEAREISLKKLSFSFHTRPLACMLSHSYIKHMHMRTHTHSHTYLHTCAHTCERTRTRGNHVITQRLSLKQLVAGGPGGALFPPKICRVCVPVHHGPRLHLPLLQAHDSIVPGQHWRQVAESSLCRQVNKKGAKLQLGTGRGSTPVDDPFANRAQIEHDINAIT